MKYLSRREVCATVCFIFEQLREESSHPSNIRLLIQMPQQKMCVNFKIESPSQIYSLAIHCTVLHAFVCVWYLNCDWSLFSHPTHQLHCH